MIEELSTASKEVLPAPTPTAGTLPTCFDCVSVAEAACASGLVGLVEMTIDAGGLAVA